jgi:hypothetical protein
MKKLLLLVPLILMLSTVFGLTLPIIVDSTSSETILNEINSLGLDIEDSLSNGNKITISCSDETITDPQICVEDRYCEYNDDFLNSEDYSLNNCIDRVSALEQISFRSVRGAQPYSYDANNLEDICIIFGDSAQSIGYVLDENILDSDSNHGNLQNYLPSDYSDLSYKQKCNELYNSAIEYQTATGNDFWFCYTDTSQASGCLPRVDVNENSMIFRESSDFIVSESEWISSNELLIEEIENPINLDINIYSKQYPDFDFEGVYPVGTTLVIDASSSSPEGINLTSPSTTNPDFVETDSLVFEQILNTASNQEVTVNFTFEYTDENNIQWSKNYPITLTVEDTIFSSISTTSLNIKPNEFTTFTIKGDSLSSDTLSYFFDSGQRKKAYGELVEVSGSIQCKEFEREGGVLDQCILADAIYEGTPTIGAPCGCDTFAGSKAIYIGQKSETLSETSFEEFIPVKYDSKDSCGEDRNCEATLTVTSSSGLSSTKSIILNLPSAETCNLFSNSIETSTNSSAFVGSVEDGTISCYCKLGYKPVIDTSSSLPGTSSSKKCIKEIVKTETNTTTQKPPIIPTPSPPPPAQSPYIPPSSSNIDEYNTKEPLEAESGSNLGIIFLILILLCALVVAGFEFYERKKTGSFVNPFAKFMKKSSKSLSMKKDTKTISPIQRFITQARTAGESNDTIRQNLMNSGWPEEEINKYL